jgi:small conductance mechanosensitive channel
MLESEKINDLVTTYAIPWGVNIVFAIAIFIIGRIIAKAIVKVLKRVLQKSEMDEILINFVSSIVNIALLLAIVIASLDQLGVDTTSLIALLGAAGLAIGLALKDSLQNFASGVMLIIFRPFATDDLVEVNGITGVVEKITIFNTVLRTADNCEVIVPNGSVYSGNITNYSSKGTRRVDMMFGIGYEDDIKKAKDIMLDIVSRDERILKDPKPVVAVAELADSSVNFHVRPWVKSADYWAVHFDVTEKIKLAFDENGISIPYPQMDLHIDKTE